MTADFLLELRSEEIPARMQARARNDLARMFAEELDKAGLAAEAIETFATPRRLALIARALPLATDSQSEEIKGPRSSAPPQALEGFLRKTGLTREQLVERDGVFFAVIDRPGQATSEVLRRIIEMIVLRFPWAKSMRWGAGSASSESLRWVRPLHNILAMFGSDPIPVDMSLFANVYTNRTGDLHFEQVSTGVSSAAATLGHRFHHPGPITIGGANDYAEKLRACHVIVDQDERARIIREGAHALAAQAGLQLIEDEGLVAENAGLTEWPVPLLGRFDPEFLDVPPEVIQLTARINQKYFVLRDSEGALAPAFICTANIAAKDGGAAIVQGNQRVLAARLSDARFFWEQDLKVPLEEQARKLEQIVFHEKLGTVADKVERVAKLARWLVEEGIINGADADQAGRAARLAKADLVTGMVGEFPELQGIIGGYLAEAQGESKAVADAVRDHYKPVGQGDEVPTAPVTVAVSLADKLDTLASFFDIRELPTGSKDPFALRRAALGVISLIRENQLKLHLGQVIRMGWLGVHESNSLSDEQIERLSVADTLGVFFADRLEVALKADGIRHDLVQASTRWEAATDGRIDRIENRARSLQSFVETTDGLNLLAGYKRAGNILKKEDWNWQDEGGSSKPPEEAALIAALDEAEPHATQAIKAEDFRSAMSALASLRAPIDAFFDKVTVNDADPEVRARRLNLLARFRDAVHRVADFSRIEG